MDTPAPPPLRAELSDVDRRATTTERAPAPANPMPLSRGNSPELTEAAESERARGPETPPEPQPEPTPPQPEAPRLPEADRGARRPPIETPKAASGALGEALRNLQKYVQNQTFHNPQGGQTDPGTAIQFDTKGVEFGPWIRRFVAQVRRNWFVPQAAWAFRGRVVLQFNIHRDGRITDVVGGAAVRDRRFQPRLLQRHPRLQSHRAAAAGVPGGQGVLHRHLLLQRAAQLDKRHGILVLLSS